jgi:hypothetical protein
MACFWYGIGSDKEDSWMYEERVSDMDLAHRYLISLHWSLAQFSGGMDEFRARNGKERCYAVSMCLLAFMMAAICISDLTSSMTRLHILSSHQSRQLAILRRYLQQNGISDKLSLRMQRNALHAISEQQRLMAEHHVELLTTVSEPLRVELHFEMYSPVLEVHPFFFDYIKECPQVMCRVCHQAMSTLLVSHGDIIFTVGEIPVNPQMYIVCNGIMEYVPAAGAVTEVSSEQWLSEGALWTHWMHRGVLKGTTDGRLCVLDAKLFAGIVSMFDDQAVDPKDYAVHYVDQLNEAEKEGLAITDLPMGTEEDVDYCGKGRRTSRHHKLDLDVLRDVVVGRHTMMDHNIRKRKSVFMKDANQKGGRGTFFFGNQPSDEEKKKVGSGGGDHMSALEEDEEDDEQEDSNYESAHEEAYMSPYDSTRASLSLEKRGSVESEIVSPQVTLQ